MADSRRLINVAPNLYKRGRGYYARYMEKGKPVLKSLKTQEESEARRRLNRLRPGRESPQLSAGGVTVGSFAIEWLDRYTPNKGPRAKKNSRERVEYHLAPSIGHIPLAKLGLREILEYRNDLEEHGLAVDTVHSYLSDFRAMLNMAVDLGALQKSPFIARRIMPKLQEKDVRGESMLSEAKIKTILSVALPEHRAAIELGLYTGCRWGELRDLKWAHVDPSCSKITISQTKSGKNRTVPLSPKAKKTLEWIKNTWGDNDYILPQRPMYPTQFPRHTRIQTGLKWKYKDLRDTFACNWVDSRGSLGSLQILLGHASVKTTEMHYAKLGDESVAAEVTRVFG